MADFTLFPHGADLGHGVQVFAGYGKAGEKFGFVKVNGEMVTKATGPNYWNVLIAAAAEFLPLPDEAATIYDEVQLTLAA